MQYIGQLFDFIQRLVVWWIVVAPWENALRIRGGKRVKVLTAGIHLRIPFYDTTYLQAMRLRVVALAPQTVSTKDGHTVTVMVNIGYSISDLKLMYETISQPEMTICNYVTGAIAEAISGTMKDQLSTTLVEEYVAKAVDGSAFGIKFDNVKITGLAIVRTIRLIQDSHWTPNSLDISTPVK